MNAPKLPTRLLAAVGGLTLTLGVATGCGLGGGVYDAPLPGGADVGDHPMTLTAEFDDVLDLVPQSSVRVDHVPVGRVDDIRLEPDGRSAEVSLIVNGDVRLPAGTTARLEQTSLLGEKYVALVRPAPVRGQARTSTAAADTGELESGDTIALADTSAAVEVEELLGSLSSVLNGGGIGQFQEISRELQKIGGGRTQEMKAFLEQMEHFVTALDNRRGAITDAIDGLDRLGTTLEDNSDQLTRALDGLSPGMDALADQRPQLVKMMRSLDRLSRVTVSTLNKSQRNIVEDLRMLAPVLRKLADAGEDLPYSMEILLTYPFPDAVLGAIRGDYINVFVTTNFRTLPANCAESGCFWPQVGAGSAGPGGAAGRSLTPQSQPSSEAPPTLLPPTDSPLPGAPSSSVPGPDLADPDPTDGPTDGGSPGDPGSTDPSDPTDPTDPGSPSGSADPSEPPGSPSPSGSTSPVAPLTSGTEGE